MNIKIFLVMLGSGILFFSSLAQGQGEFLLPPPTGAEKERPPRQSVSFVVDDVKKADFQLRENIFTQTIRWEHLTEHVAIYPFVKPADDVVYIVSWFENTSNETVPKVKDTWVGLLGNTLLLSSHAQTSSPLPPGKTRLNWLVLFRRMAPKTGESWESPAPLIPWGSSVDETCAPYVEVKNRFESRDLKEMKRIHDWFFSFSRKTPTGDDVYDFYLNDEGIAADETLLASPSTIRDEIQLTRMMLEYLRDEGTMEAVTDFVSSRPFPQRIVMTYRLFRLDPPISETRMDPKAYWEMGHGYFPPPLPEGWEAKLLKLNEKFREIRENALNE